MSFTVAIVGRPNVGKSTLFNRLVGERDAIVDDQSGVTRDRKYGESYWNGKNFDVIDTGGFVAHSDDIFEKAIRQQVAIAMEEASVILFMVDVTTGITDLDDEVANLLRRSPKKTFLVVNKVDNHKRLLEAQEFYLLGFPDTFFLSSMSGSGTGELLDALAQLIPATSQTTDNEAIIEPDNSSSRRRKYFDTETMEKEESDDFPFFDDEDDEDKYEEGSIDDTDEYFDEEDIDGDDDVSYSEAEADQQDDEKLAGTESSVIRIPRVAIVGQPNVGKSSLLNALVGHNRNIVTDIAGTTRDSTDTRYKLFNKDFILVDTAGIRKKSKVHENLEFYSVMRAVKAIESADVCMLIIDATLGIEAQDVNIFKLAQDRRKGIVILVNKWDLIEKDTKTSLEYEKRIRERIAPFTDVPIIFISALEKTRIFKAIETALEVYDRIKMRIPTRQLNEVLLAAIEKYPPPAVRGQHIKIKYITQLPTYTPQFAFFCNFPKLVREAYRNYLENQLRKTFNFSGVPLQLFFRQK